MKGLKQVAQVVLLRSKIVEIDRIGFHDQGNPIDKLDNRVVESFDLVGVVGQQPDPGYV